MSEERNDRERLSRKGVAGLWQVKDLTSLAVMADTRRQAASGRDSYYRLSLHSGADPRISSACPYCSLGTNRFPTDESSLELLVDSCDREVAGELHVGGELAFVEDLEGACALVRRANRLRPRLAVRAFTWKDVRRWSLARNEPAGRILATLVDCGLAAMAGEPIGTPQAEADLGAGLSPEDLQSWLAAAAEAGIRSELSWMVGADEDADAVGDLLTRIRDAQDRYGVIDCLTPYPLPKLGERGETLESTGYQWMKSIAVARIVLDDIPHVRVCAGVTADALVQLAQWYGADDAGSALLPSEAAVESGLPEGRLRRLLQESGVRPINVFSDEP